jgi:hypothetical protein
MHVCGDSRKTVSPPEWAAELADTFERSKRVQVASGAHVFEGLSGLDTCLDATILRLLDTGDVERLDTRCFDSMKPGPFTEP